jgi:hypothetical protein
MSPRTTKNDRTITLTDEALSVYDSWPHMEKSKRVSDAIIEKHSRGEYVTRQEFEELVKRLKELEGR